MNRFSSLLLLVFVIASLSSCSRPRVAELNVDDELVRCIEGGAFREHVKQSGASSEWASHCIVYSSRPVYTMRTWEMSVRVAKPGEKAGDNYAALGGEEGKTKMIVKGCMMVERRRENALIDVGLFQLIPWSGKSEYLKVPLDFTYYSSFPVPADKK